MRDFYTKDGYFIYDPIAKDFSMVQDEDVVLQRVSNLLSVYSSQWQVNNEAGIDYDTLFQGTNINLALDVIRNKITQDPNVTGFANFSFSYIDNVLAIVAEIIINGKNFTINIENRL